MLCNNIAGLVAAFDTKGNVMRNKPAPTIGKLGKGVVLRLDYWPAGDDVSNDLPHLD